MFIQTGSSNSVPEIFGSQKRLGMLSEIINSIYPISLISIKAIEDLVKSSSFQKKEIIVKKGLHNNEEYFVLDGIVRSDILNPQGEEVTYLFSAQTLF